MNAMTPFSNLHMTAPQRARMGLVFVGLVLIAIAAWTVIRVRREFRERREAIKAKHAGLCTCNYPRPPGMLKCPECGGDMVMK